jgi:hypothetical protein
VQRAQLGLGHEPPALPLELRASLPSPGHWASACHALHAMELLQQLLGSFPALADGLLAAGAAQQLLGVELQSPDARHRAAAVQLLAALAQHGGAEFKSQLVAGARRALVELAGRPEALPLGRCPAELELLQASGGLLLLLLLLPPPRMPRKQLHPRPPRLPCRGCNGVHTLLHAWRLAGLKVLP